MGKTCKSMRKGASYARNLGFPALVAVSLAGNVQAQEIALETPAPRFINFETANMLPDGTWSLKIGSHQTVNSGGGTGNQVYFGAVDWAASDRLTFGLTAQVQEDALAKPILGVTPPTRFATLGASLKYGILQSESVNVAALASVEYFQFRTSLFGTDVSDTNHVVGSLQLPVSWNASPGLQVHLTPGVSFLPDTLNGIPYYGTVAFVGLGASYQASNRLQFFAGLNQPLSGGNTIESDRSISRKTVYTAGARYAFTPKVALEGYVTNAVGISPATGILTFWPEGNEPMFGLNVQYTPNARFPQTYRPQPIRPATTRDRLLQEDGFILSSASVMDAGHGKIYGSGGSDGNWAAGVSLSPDRDFQLDALIEQYALDGSVPGSLNPTPGEARYMVGGRIRVLDQSHGDPMSWTLRVLGGRDIEDFNVGAIYIASPMSFETSERLALNLNPAVAAFGNTEIFGLGAGVNYELLDGLQVIGEVTGVSQGNAPVWAAGLRHTMSNGLVSLDLSATNSIGRHGLGTLVAQDNVRYSLGVTIATKLFNR